MERLILLFIIESIFLYNISAQEHLTIEKIDLRKGYTYYKINCINSDSANFLWVGTNKSLFRYDGYEFKEIFTKNILSNFDGSLKGLFVDNQNNKWFFNSDKVYKSVSSGVYKKYNLQIILKENNIIRYLNKIVFSKNKNLFAVTEERSSINRKSSYFVYQYHEKKDSFVLVNSVTETKSNPQCVIITKKEEIVVFYRDSICIRSILGNTIRKKILLDEKLGYPSIEQYYYSFTEDETGNIYYGTSKGYLCKIEINNFSKIKHILINGTDKYNGNQIVALYYDDVADVVFISTLRNGVFYWSAKNKAVYSVYLNNMDRLKSDFDYIEVFFIDKNRNLWFGSNSTGIYKTILRSKFTSLYSITDNPELNFENRILSFLQKDKNGIWLGTLKGLLYFSFQTRKTSYYTFKKNAIIFSLGLLKNGNILCNTQFGLKVFDTKKNIFYEINLPNKYEQINKSKVYAKLPDNEIIIGYKKILKFSSDLKKCQIVCLEDNKSPVRKVIVCDQYLYILNSIGKLYRYNWIENIAQPIIYICNDDNKATANNLFLGNDKLLYFSTRANKIYKQTLSPDGKTLMFSNIGLENETFIEFDIIDIIYQQEDFVWFITRKHGLWRYSMEDSTCVKFDYKFGIDIEDFQKDSYYKNSVGDIYLGGKQKFIRIKPDFFKHEQTEPKITVTGLKILGEERHFNRDINDLEEIYLSYADNYFTFDFACLDYTDATNNQFKHMLEGFDSDWINDHNKRSASYTNLPGGKYKFHVIGANSEGKWDFIGKSIIINIEKPPWKKWYAYVLFTLFPLIIITGFLFFRHRKNQEKLSLVKKYAGDMLKIQEEERARISRDIHDAATQQVVAAKMKLNIARENGFTNEEILEAENLLEDSIKNLREISHDLHPSILKDLGLKRSLKNLFHKFSSRTGINSNIDNLDLPEELKNGLDINIYRIVQESLNNIEKHSNAKNVKFEYNTFDDKVIFSIKDDGSGFDVQKIMNNNERTSLGLRNISERVNYFDGFCEIWSDEYHGTTIKITIPLKYK